MYNIDYNSGQEFTTNEMVINNGWSVRTINRQLLKPIIINQ